MITVTSKVPFSTVSVKLCWVVVVPAAAVTVNKKLPAVPRAGVPDIWPLLNTRPEGRFPLVRVYVIVPVPPVATMFAE